MAVGQVNMTQYAGVCQHELQILLKPVTNKLARAVLTLTLSCVFVREGKATSVHMFCFVNIVRNGYRGFYVAAEIVQRRDVSVFIPFSVFILGYYV